jgi:hypothetical protein
MAICQVSLAEYKVQLLLTFAKGFFTSKGRISESFKTDNTEIPLGNLAPLEFKTHRCFHVSYFSPSSMSRNAHTN